MKIDINLTVLLRHDISADEYVFLYLSLLGKEIPNVIFRKIDLKPLQDKGFIKIVDEAFIKRPKLSALFASTIETSKVEDWIDEWRDIWPKGYKSGGKPVRGSKQDCIKKMKAFLTRTGYTKDQVTSAALAYVLDRKGKNYQYMTIANYFIQKGDESSLEAWCELLAEEGDRVKDFGEFHKEV
jgi:hypothetical protein